MICLPRILMAIVLSPTLLHAEERSYPAQGAGFEVILGDPSCNGPHERLVRARLAMTATFQQVGAQEVCSLGIRGGVEREAKEMPCEDPFGVELDSDQMFQPDDKLSLTANLDICQGLWDHRISLSEALLSGTISNVPFDPIPLIQDDAWINDFEGTDHFGRIGVFIQCDAPTSGPSPRLFGATFFLHLRESASADCSTAECTEMPEKSLVRLDVDWVQAGLVVSCATPESEAAP
jgi:hypothetical protein